MFEERQSHSAGLLGNTGRYGSLPIFPKIGIPLQREIKKPALQDVYTLDTQTLHFTSDLLKEVWTANSKERVEKLKTYSLNELLNEIDRSKEAFRKEISKPVFFGMPSFTYLGDYKKMYSSFLAFFAADRALQFFVDEKNAQGSEFFSRKVLSKEELKLVAQVEAENQEFYNPFDKVLVRAMVYYYSEYVAKPVHNEETQRFYDDAEKKMLELKKEHEARIIERQKKRLFNGPL